jgi:ligand-binding SRPBCC domain-containing protein
VRTGIIGRDETVTWRARHFGITWTMTTIISEWDRPHRFVDRQAHGPFQEFVHEHVFEPVDHGVLVTDHVRFAAPLGPLGWIAEQLVLKRYMPKLITTRNDFMVAEALKRGGPSHGDAIALE